MNIRKLAAACVLAASVLGAATGCTSLRTVPVETDPTAPAFSRVNPGDTVEVTTRDGQRFKFIVDEVHRDALVSVEGIRYTPADLSELRRQSTDVPKSIGLAWLLLGALAGIGLGL